MKKIYLFFLMLTVLLSFCACTQETGSDGQNQIPEQQISAEGGGPEQSQGLSFEEILKGEAYLIHYKGTVTFEGQSFEADVTFATNGEDTSICNVMGDVTGHILVKDGVTYQIDDANKTYTAIYEEDGTNDILDTTDQEPSGTGTAEIDGKQLPYKEYVDGEETTRFYFEGDKFYAIATKSPESSSMMLVLKFTDKVPAGMLELPGGYVEAEGAAIPGEALSPENLDQYVDELNKEMESAEYPEVEASE